MAEPFLGEIRLFSFTTVPRGWGECDGRLLPIAQNQALFALLGTMYGGDGRTTFALPDLRDRVAMHRGENTQGTSGGEPTHTLIRQELPAHSHGLAVSNDKGTAATPQGNYLGSVADAYAPMDSHSTVLHADTVTAVGQGAPHENRQPFLVLGYCIALQGIFPSRS